MIRALNHKFFAKRCVRGDQKFASKLERSAFDLLTSLQNAGKILFFLSQIPIQIGGGHKYVCDYLVFTQEECYFIEVKGKMLPMSKLKLDQAEEKLGVQIHVVTDPKQILAILFP